MDWRALTGRSMIIATLVLVLALSANCDISINTNDLKIILDEEETVSITVRNLSDSSTLYFWAQHDDIVAIRPNATELEPTQASYKINATVRGIGAGHSEITTNSSNSALSTDSIFLRVLVLRNEGLEIFSVVVGWIYFVAWSVSFYPQIYENYKRKSVVGLNFDFLALNIVGFTLYGIFNLGLYFIPEIKEEYSHRHPRGLNPVQVNDIFFAVHAAFACIITIIQCFRYEKSDQRVSTTARIILGAFGVFILISVILSATDVIHWLDFLYYCSYVKLTITLIKYIPQAYMNYKRKSTVGWSIGNIFLDFTGGMLSMLQMILNAYNYDDWVSIFGDPTKFGLGLFSVIFDIFFIVQHYVLYRHSSYEQRT